MLYDTVQDTTSQNADFSDQYLFDSKFNLLSEFSTESDYEKNDDMKTCYSTFSNLSIDPVQKEKDDNFKASWIKTHSQKPAFVQRKAK